MTFHDDDELEREIDLITNYKLRINIQESI